MYCKRCGKEIDDKAAVCPHCGVSTGRYLSYEGDAPSAGFGVLGFFFPLIGLILYLVWKDQYPMRAKSVGKGALIGVIVSVVISIISVVIAVAVGTTATYRYYY
ncbi:MAG: zinc ribbon domain-containing protein [Clostridia bacterium]|nr:zinc ribbon domain-containing protein [Clostridia bacterium]